tara:strand:- start:202 stop:930 length:729 start_codon:yes stop_codon:yes gene_type:complete
MSNHNKNSNIVTSIVSFITGNNHKNGKVTNYDINDSAISSSVYKTIDNKPVVNIIRDRGPVTGENTIYYVPEVIPKDTMNPNDIGSTEYRAGYLSEKVPSSAWVDYNISQFPGYYRSDFGEGKRSLKQFFDSRYRFHSVPNNKKYYESKKSGCSNCYTDVNGTKVCNYNAKLEKIPSTLYNVGPNGESIIQPITYADIDGYHYESDRPMNGAPFYNNVYGTDSVKDLIKPYINDDKTTCLSQ